VRCTLYKIIGQLYAASQLLSAQISYALRQKFWSHVTSTPDPIVCDLVTTGIVRQPERTYAVAASCRKESAACYLPTFLAAHQQELHIIADYLARHPHVLKDQVRLERLLT